MDSRELEKKLSKSPAPRVLVVGDLMLDRYVSGDVARISPEAPIAVLSANASESRMGGAGNVVANLRSMNASVDLIGVIGDDGRGRQLREMFDEIGTDTSGVVVDPSRPTTEKTRMLTGMHQLLRVDWELSAAVSPEVEAQLIDSMERGVQKADAVVLSDYGKGALSDRILNRAAEICRQHKVPLLVDPKGEDYKRYKGASLITPNRKEAELALGRSLATMDDVRAAAKQLLDEVELDTAIITLGPEGMYYLNRDGSSGRVPTFARAVFDVTGAGDTVISHLALALGAGLPIEEAVFLANHAAGLVVGRRGAAVVTLPELMAEIAGHAEAGAVLSDETLDSALARWRAQGKRVVFTNGCFDLLHRGHVAYLRQARSKGDVLLVGINDDASVQRLKGPTRPVHPVEDRAFVLAALEMVDAVIPFKEDTPLELIQRVSPQVLVKGEDWADKGVVGREWVESHGGEVFLAPLEVGHSTTGTVERVREALRREGS